MPLEGSGFQAWRASCAQVLSLVMCASWECARKDACQLFRRSTRRRVAAGVRFSERVRRDDAVPSFFTPRTNPP